MNHARDAIDELIGFGALRDDDLVGGELRAIDVSRRNRNLRIESGAGNWFVKEPGPAGDPHPEHVRTVRREAGWLAWVRDEPGAGALRALCPRLMSFDPLRNRAIVELVPGRPLADPTSGMVALEDARALGTTLARLHAAAAVHTAALAQPGKPPWITALPLNDEQGLRPPSAGALAVMRAVRSDPMLVAALLAYLRGWTTSTIIHGDPRRDNVLIDESDGTARLVDWELVDAGDPSWDLALAAQTLLLPHLLTQPPAAALAHGAPATEALWDGYEDVPSAPAVPLLRRRLGLAAALMLAAYEVSAGTPTAPPGAAVLLEAARGVLAPLYQESRA